MICNVNKIKIFFAAIIGVIIVILFPDCSPDITGGGSEAGNARITGMITDTNGSPVQKVIVKIMSSDYDPVKDKPSESVSVDTTDKVGVYEFKVKKDHTYSIQAVHMISRERALIPFVFPESLNDTAPSCILRKPGALRVMLPANIASDSGYLYIPGTTFHSRFKHSEKHVFMDSIPAGIIPLLLYSSEDIEEPVALDENINITAGDTVNITFPDWAYSKEIILNTSVSGADIRGTVYQFPVLVRLNTDNFDFSQARNEGEDIRFTCSDGKPLPHEIELWDKTSESADIWVLVDSILGDDSTQYIILYWGNPDAETLLNDNAVFDTAAGFQGVWHLGDISGNGNIPDATVNKYNGVFPDTAEPQPSEGVIGNCRVFDGVDDFITMPNTSDSKLNFPEKGNYTVSAWVRLDTLDGEPHLIVAKGFSQYFLRFTYFPSDSPSWEFSEFSDTRLWQACTSSASSRQWTLVTGVREGNRQLLYCNGVLADSTPNSYPNDSFTRDMSNDLSVGKLLAAVEVHGVVNESHCFFKGSIDEIRIENRVRNSDWIKLCYMNQGPENMLVRFK